MLRMFTRAPDRAFSRHSRIMQPFAEHHRIITHAHQDFAARRKGE
jgi:hypothetical protein